ncbi:universal stress protein [Aureitalea sp. L0-47]|uniref:universal stress protein n=1 Tax=Aureitalea sp. L0-47 TaxID=2816962 RepID=UPI00223767B7|nr:universal stress protein [Aureitalea sp. L0-47]MCW5518257.1 universal stress protein [Aureitalea sp. L0-47]
MKLLEKILVALDFSNSSENVLANAIEMAKIFDSTIIPIHILPDNISNDKVRESLQETTVTKLQEVEKQISDEGVSVKKSLLMTGTPYKAITRAALDTGANLILMGSGETKKSDSFRLGTTAQRVIHRSEKPVFIIKEGVLLNVHHILCPVDFSPTSKRALNNAITMARRFKSELTILAVCEPEGSNWFFSEKEQEREIEHQYSMHKKDLDSFLKDFNLRDLNWTKEIPKGNPSEEILSSISRKMIDLLVIGTAGRTGINRMLMGSVTEKVVREVPCSFLTLKSQDVISLQLETDMRDIQELHETAMKLIDDGFYDQAIGHLEACLSISAIHVPAHRGLAKAYEKLGEQEKANKYRANVRDILDQMWNQKIEDEVRKLRRK